MANKLPSPSVWINSQRCTFGNSVFDSILSRSNTLKQDSPTRSADALHYDRTFVSLQQDSDNRLRLSPTVAFDGSGNAKGIPFGRSRRCPPLGSHPCPTTVATTRAATQAKQLSQASANKNIRRFVQLAVVGLVVSPQNEIMITRRPSYMRSFPGAWVFPGGSVDATDETLEAAVAREVWEETGLKLSPKPIGRTDGSNGWKVESVWESVFPTIPEPEVPIKRHHLVVYLSIQLSEREMSEMALNLCKEEVDAAAWLSPDNVQAILESSLAAKEKPLAKEECFVDLLTTSTDVEKEPLNHFSGIYPRCDDDDFSSEHPFGMAQGSLFALQEYCDRHGYRRSML